jgi:hypothetical protein
MEVLCVLRVYLHDLRVFFAVSNTTAAANIVNIMVVWGIGRALKGIKAAVGSCTMGSCGLLVV